MAHSTTADDDSIDTSNLEFQINRIDTVEDDEYDERVTAVVELTHPALETIVAQYHVTRGHKHDETDEITEHVEYHVNSGDKFDLSSLVKDTDLSFAPREYLADTDTDLIDGVRASIRYGDTETVVDDLLDDTEREEWLLRSDE